MNTTHTFGGARLSLIISSAVPGVPHDPLIPAQAQRFLSLLDKAHALGAQEPFFRFLEAFASEVNDYLDGRQVAQVDPRDPASMTWKEMEDLEIAASLAAKKRERP